VNEREREREREREIWEGGSTIIIKYKKIL
jgi:hypothetical protein